MRIVIAGGHGKIALLLERLLAERGDQVVGLIRNPAQVAGVRQAGAEAVVCDLERASAGDVTVLLAGADAVVFAAACGLSGRTPGPLFRPRRSRPSPAVTLGVAGRRRRADRGSCPQATFETSNNFHETRCLYLRPGQAFPGHRPTQLLKCPLTSIDAGSLAEASGGRRGLGQRTLSGLAKAFKRDRDRATFDPGIDAQEAFRAGVSLGRQGDVEGARVAYQQAIDSGDAEHAPAAGFHLGLLLGQHDDIEGAKEAYRVAGNSGHPEYGPKAARNLGHLYKRQSRARQAIAAYEVAAGYGHPDVTPWAMLYLGNLLLSLENLADARAAYQGAVDSGHPEAAPRAAEHLADLS